MSAFFAIFGLAFMFVALWGFAHDVEKWFRGWRERRRLEALYRAPSAPDRERWLA